MSDIRKRVRLVREDYAERPDYDAQMPIIYVEYRHGARPVAGKDYLPSEGNINSAWRYFDREDFERWLTAFVGPHSQFSAYDDRDGYYYRVATPEWRDAMGLTDEYMTGAGLTMATLLEGPDDYEHWVNGETYGCIPEKLVGYVPVIDSGSDEIADDVDWSAIDYRWEGDDEVGSCWGFYGRDYAIEAALNEFYNQAEEFIVVDEDGNEVQRSQAAQRQKEEA